MSKYIEIDKSPERIFAIGDIHGCRKELVYLIEHLESNESLSKDDLLVFIGDYVDRGPDSRGVVDFLLEVKKTYPSTVFLRGNHEDMLLDYLGFEGSQGAMYLYNGGEDTFESYGCTENEDHESVLTSIPKEHLAFYLNLERMLLVDEYVFVHAGLNPLRSIKTQLNEDIFWIRGEFINNIHNFEKTVVFGHTVYRDVFIDMPYKIGIDTGLVYGNLLTCIEVNSKMIYQIGLGKRKVRSYPFKKKSGKRKAAKFF